MKELARLLKKYYVQIYKRDVVGLLASRVRQVLNLIEGDLEDA